MITESEKIFGYQNSLLLYLIRNQFYFSHHEAKNLAYTKMRGENKITL